MRTNDRTGSPRINATRSTRPQEGGYVVTAPALNGLTTEGDTLEEARAMAEDAIRCYLESLQKHGEEIPVESDAPMRRIAVSLSRA